MSQLALPLVLSMLSSSTLSLLLTLRSCVIRYWTWFLMHTYIKQKVTKLCSGSSEHYIRSRPGARQAKCLSGLRDSKRMAMPQVSRSPRQKIPSQRASLKTRSSHAIRARLKKHGACSTWTSGDLSGRINFAICDCAESGKAQPLSIANNHCQRPGLPDYDFS
jgi:hypothetical protein